MQGAATGVANGTRKGKSKGGLSSGSLPPRHALGVTPKSKPKVAWVENDNEPICTPAAVQHKKHYATPELGMLCRANQIPTTPAAFKTPATITEKLAVAEQEGDFGVMRSFGRWTK